MPPAPFTFHAPSAYLPHDRRARTKLAALIFLAIAAAGVVVFILMGRGGTSPRGGAELAKNSSPQSGARPGVPGPAKIDAILNATEDLKRQSKFVEAKAILQESLASHASEPSLYQQLAQVNTSLGDYGSSYAAYEKALAAGANDPDTLMAAGTAASAAGKQDRAAEHFAAAQLAKPTDWQAPLFLAQVQVKLKQFQEAKKNLLIAGRLKPDCAICWGTLADVALRENATSIALDQIQRARELEPDSVLWRLIQARALKRMGKPEDALLLLVGLDTTQRAEPGVLPLMGECLGLLKRPADAAKLYAEMSDTFADNPGFAFEAAQWHDRAGDRLNAKKYAQRALYLGNKDAQAMAEGK